MKNKQDTNYKGSWAEQEFLRKQNEKVEKNENWGKPAIIHPDLKNAISLGPIDHKWARIFNG